MRKNTHNIRKLKTKQKVLFQNSILNNGIINSVDIYIFITTGCVLSIVRRKNEYTVFSYENYIKHFASLNSLWSR